MAYVVYVVWIVWRMMQPSYTYHSLVLHHHQGAALEVREALGLHLTVERICAAPHHTTAGTQQAGQCAQW
jgi:hypothetical protein